MKRTTGIFIFAGLLTMVAILLARGMESTPTPKPPPLPPKVASVTSGAVSLSAALSGSHLLRGGSGEVYLDISLSAGKAKKSKRVPLNVGLVIDRSGSMAGPKLSHAKEAARRLIASLREGDRLSIVTYGSDVTLVPYQVISASSRAHLTSVVNSIVDGGGTYLSGGFERARDEVLRASADGYLNRVILISDGQANEGVIDTGKLSQMARNPLDRRVHLTTMGVGLSFNETLMTAMAEYGGGHYYFIEDSSSMAGIFSKELKTLMDTVARKATVTMTLEPGVELVEIFGYTYQQNGRDVTIKLPDIFGGQQRKIMCKLKVPAEKLGELAVAQVKLTFLDVNTDSELSTATAARVNVTRDASEVASGKNKEVLVKAEQVLISKNLNEAMTAYGTGNVSAAKATLNAQISRVMRANADLKDPYLHRMVGKMRRKLKATEAAPSSARGRALIKGTKFDAYKMSK